MKTITIKNQEQFNKLKKSYKKPTEIHIVGEIETINYTPNNAYYVIRDNAVIKNVRGNAVIEYVVDNAVIKNVRDSAIIKNVGGNAVIEDVWDNVVIRNVKNNAVIKYVRDNAVIKYVRDNAVIGNVWGNAVIEYVGNNVVIECVRGNAVVEYVKNNAVIGCVVDSAMIKSVWNDATVNLYGHSVVLDVRDQVKITTYGYNIVRYNSGQKDIKLKLSKDTIVIKKKEFKPTFEEYRKLFPVVVRGKYALMYKAVRKIDNKYIADYDKKVEYKIGETMKSEIDKSQENSCSTGLHIAYKDWAIEFGKYWKNMALLECRVPIDKIVVAKDCDGKVRTSELKVIREVPKDEW